MILYKLLVLDKNTLITYNCQQMIINEVQFKKMIAMKC